MAFDHLVLLAPCHGLEDFPLYHTGDDAASLLACWTGLWHPTLLANAKGLPRIERCDYPPDDLAGCLFVLPKPCEAELSPDLPDEIEEVNSVLLRDSTGDRQQLVASALDRYPSTAVCSELVEDFFAFGFALLQVELLTQQMRYASSIDQSRIQRLILEAAKLAVDGDTETCREKLRLGHDALSDERNHYYPVDVYFLDLTLAVEATLGKPLLDALDSKIPFNLLMTGQLIEQVAEHHPALLQKMKAAVEADTLGFAGGEYQELPLPLLTPDTAARQLQRGQARWEQVVGRAPRTFARRKTGLYPSFESLLRLAGVQAALHMRFDAGKYPESQQNKSTWSPVADQPGLSVLGKQPLDANLPQTFLDLPRELSDAMDTEFVAVRAFWHWPGHTVPWYEDLRRACLLGDALGKFVTLDQFFADSPEANSDDGFEVARYRYPLLQAWDASTGFPQQVIAQYWDVAIELLVNGGLATMSQTLGAEVGSWQAPLRESELLHDAFFEKNDVDSTVMGAARERLERTLAEHLLVSPTEKVSSLHQTNRAEARTVVNPLPFARRILLRGADMRGSIVGDAVYASANDGKQQLVLVDVPAMGFATISHQDAPPKDLSGPELASETTLQNEFFEAVVDEVTGALRALRNHGARQTRISQQLALRISLPKTGQHWVDRQAPVAYSVMAADRCEITANGKVFAEITTAGRLLAPNGDTVGRFVQRFQVTRGSRILTIEMEIQPLPELLLADEPWDSYYASRFAFADEAAELVAGRHHQAIRVSSSRFEAPMFVEIDSLPPSFSQSVQQRTTIFSGGVPFHRRVTATQLDTLLITGRPSAGAAAQEDQNHSADALGEDLPWFHFRMGVGVDVSSPVHAAIDWQGQALPPIVFSGSTNMSAGWLFCATAKNVLISAWAPQPDGSIRMRMVETLGQSTKFQLHAYRGWKSLHHVQLDGTILNEVEIADGAGVLSIGPLEMLEICGTF